MKNREKFRDEIIEVLKTDDLINLKMCRFVKDNVIPRFVPEENVRENPCGFLTCETCSKMFAFWLDEEYVEPPKPEVDWSKVPVDTLVRVRDDQNGPGRLMYFSCYKPNNIYRYETWKNGTTSKTADGVQKWLFCELVEDEDE